MRLASPFKREEINGDGACATYLFRWTLFRWGDVAVYLHHFVGDDWSFDFHDHPKRFVSIGLKGGYEEETPVGIWDFEPPKITRFMAPWFRTFPAEHRHRLVMFRRPDGSLADCWTLVMVGKKVRPWGFWHFGQFVPWKTYVQDRAMVQLVRSCGGED